MFVVIYVDDILIIAKNEKLITRIGNELKRSFDVRDLGNVGCCLGIEFVRHDDGYAMHQKGFVRDVLTCFGMSDCKPVSTPLDVSKRLHRNVSPNEEVELVPYRELIGSLMYIAMGTRPDIVHAVSYLSSFNNCYRHDHWIAAKRVLRYLKGTMDWAITYRRDGERPCIGFVDADWENSPDDRKSYTHL